VVEEAEARQRLRQRISDKHRQLAEYIRSAEPRSGTLQIVSTIMAGLAGLLTAAPAVGGPTLTSSLSQALGTGAEAPSWRLLCAAATICSFVSTTALSIYRTQDIANRLGKAQAAKARLESLETFLDTTSLPVEKAVDEYTRVVQDVSFVSR
jgi:hypothetical protein